MKQIIQILILTIVYTLVLWGAGCAAVPVAATTHKLTSTPETLKTFAGFLDFILPVAMLALAIAVALYFLLPAGHTLSLTLAGVAGGVEALALLLKVSLWLVPWFAGVLAAGALAALGYEVYIKYFKTAKTA